MLSNPLYTLHHGDCMELLGTLPDHSVDAVITDPPYGTTNLQWDSPPPLLEWWQQLERVAKPEGVIVVFSAQPFTTDVITSNRQHFRYELIWQKTKAVGWLDANKRPLRSHENILVFCKHFRGAKNAKISTYNPQKTTGKPYRQHRRNEQPTAHYSQNTPRVSTVNDGDRHPTSVLTFPHDRTSLHPTQKPIDLMRWLVRSYTNPGETVLDPYMGSGSSGHACIAEGRRFIGIERDRAYYDTARVRLDTVMLLRRSHEETP